MAKAADVYFRVDPWKIIEEGFDPAYSRVSESVFSLANETLGVRGCFDEGGSVDSLRGAYVNGVYDIERLNRSYRGIITETHFMIPAADWLMTEITLDGEKLDLGKVQFRDFRREMDMRRGTLERSFVWQTASGKELRLSFLRFMDMVHRERAYQRITMEALNFSGAVEISAGLSFDVLHEGYRKCFWQDVRAEGQGNRLALQGHTTLSWQEVFAGAILNIGGDAQIAEKTASLHAFLPLEQGKPLTVDKRTVILFDGDTGESLWQKGQTAVAACGQISLDEALMAQQEYWAAYWRTSDVEIEAAEGQEAAVAAEQQGIRFCSFQLAQIYNGGSMRHNIGAKGLTGEAYNGHAFWDTEACCLPFYLFTNPRAARDLLLYRYNTLPQAIERAKMLDCEGACYPLATLNGDEACSLWQHASLQLQPSTAVAYGIWHYAHVTGDRDFLYTYGAEMLLQIARFLASRVEKGGQTGKYGFFGVMGPDEFHMMVNNNAYTNYMGMRSLLCAAQTLEAMRMDRPDACAVLMEKTALGEDEITRWREIAANMYLPQDETGLIEQHDGYFNLPHTDINAIPVTQFPLYEHWSYDRIYRSDMVKQPDVLMMLYLYNTSFTEEEKRVNYEFYEPRTIHESSLSPAIHSILAAECGKMEEATQFFGFATRLDLDNYNRNTREGLHVTSIALAWVNIVYGFAGLRSDGEGLRFAPRLPDRWKKLSFSILYQGRVILIRMEKETTGFRLLRGDPLQVQVYGKPCTIGSEEIMIPSLYFVLLSGANIFT
ncbi:MAG: family 65 glycosyl hydrolase [Clostridia bacterium]|nr:family 65 glycosyl hydrolase [Clostridia bacterium]